MKYDCDITRERFDLIRKELESIRKNTRTMILDLYDVFCGMLYVLKEGCRWASVPKEYPSYKVVHYYFRNWRDSGILDEVLKKIGWKYSKKQWSERENKFYNH